MQTRRKVWQNPKILRGGRERRDPRTSQLLRGGRKCRDPRRSRLSGRVVENGVGALELCGVWRGWCGRLCGRRCGRLRGVRQATSAGECELHKVRDVD